MNIDAMAARKPMTKENMITNIWAAVWLLKRNEHR